MCPALKRIRPTKLGVGYRLKCLRIRMPTNARAGAAGETRWSTPSALEGDARTILDRGGRVRTSSQARAGWRRRAGERRRLSAPPKNDTTLERRSS